MRRSREVLEAALGRPVDMLAWPYGIHDAELQVAAKRAGYIAAFGFRDGPMRPGDDRFALPRIRITESARAERLGTLLRGRPPGDWDSGEREP